MIVVASRANQVGNALFNYAHLLAAAWEADTRLVNPYFGAYADLFPRLRHDPLCAELPGVVPAPLARAVRPGAGWVAAKVAGRAKVAMRAGRPWTGVAYFESGWSSTIDHPEGEVHVDREPFASAVRSARFVFATGPLFRFADREQFMRWQPRLSRHFRLAPDALAAGAARVAEARSRGRLVVGVHVRRRDYATFLDGRFYYDWSVYEQAMTRVAETWGGRDVAFVVCGDEPVPAGFAPDVPWTVGPGDIGGDVAALAGCDRLMGPPSTFSRWAAFTGRVPYCELLDAETDPTEGAFVQVDG